MKNKGQTGREFIHIVLITMTIVFTFGQIAFAAPPTPITDMKSQVGTVAASLCSDPSVTLTLNKVLAAKTATITLTGTVCNTGLRDYIGTVPMDAFFMVYTWHPPKTPAQEGDVKTFSHNPMGNTLKKGECKTVTKVYTINGVAKWTEANSMETGTRAAKQFVFGVDKMNLSQAGATSFSKTENCSIDNDRAWKEIYYIESAPLIINPGQGTLPSTQTKESDPKKIVHPNWLNPQPEPPLPK
jgi:hypothetical protein